MRVSREVFEQLVDQALESLPDAFRAHIANVIIEIEDQPDSRTCAELDLDDPRALLGLYHGIPLTDRHVEEPVHMPDRISIYQSNIQRICRSRDELVEQIRKTVLHEVGHYFGLDEDDLDEVGYG